MTPSSISMPISSSTKYGLPSALLASRSRSAVGTVSSRRSSASISSRVPRLESGARSMRRCSLRPLPQSGRRSYSVERVRQSRNSGTSPHAWTRWLTKSSEPSSAQCRSSSRSTIGVPLSRCKARKYDASAWKARSRICLASPAIAAMCGSACSRSRSARRSGPCTRRRGRRAPAPGRRRACPARPTADRSRGSRSARRAGRAGGRTGRCCRRAAAGPGRSAPARAASRASA